MEFQLKFKVSENLFLRDPENSEIGKSIVKNSIELIHEMVLKTSPLENWHKK